MLDDMMLSEAITLKYEVAELRNVGLNTTLREILKLNDELVGRDFERVEDI